MAALLRVIERVACLSVVATGGGGRLAHLLLTVLEVDGVHGGGVLRKRYAMAGRASARGEWDGRKQVGDGPVQKRKRDTQWVLWGMAVVALWMDAVVACGMACEWPRLDGSG